MTTVQQSLFQSGQLREVCSSDPPVVPRREGERGDAGPDLSRLSPYERAQLKLADTMRVIRTLVTEMDASPQLTAEPMQRLEMNNRIRRLEQQAKAELQQARTYSVTERRHDDFATLAQYYKHTVNLVRARYRSCCDPAGLEDSLTGMKPPLLQSSVFPEDLTEGHGSAEGMGPSADRYNIHDDVEFSHFFQQVQQNDAEIDSALDRIHSGVARLHDNAAGIRYELKMQEQQLDEVEGKTSTTHGQIVKLNIRLAKTLRKVGKVNLTVYCVCCLIVLGLGAVIYYLATH